MNEWGKIVAVKGKQAVLSIPRKEECEKCGRCRPGRGDDEMVMEAANRAGAQVGDTVEVTDEVSSPAVQLLVRFGIPLSDGIIGGILGYVLARLFNQMDNIFVWVVSVGLISMAISFVLSRKLLGDIERLKSRKFIVASIIRKQDL